MTLLAAYGFDNYTDLAEFLVIEPEWTVFVTLGNSTIETTGGRFGGGALFPKQSSNNSQWGVKLTFTSAQPTTLFFGASVNSEVFNSTDIGFLLFREDANEHLRLSHNSSTGNVEVFILGSTAGDFFMSDSQWHRLEVKLIVDGATGEVTIRLDGIEVFTSSGINTQAGSNSWTDNIAFVSEANDPDVIYDDVTCNDDQGSDNNDFLGDLRIETLRPDADTGQVDFVPQGAGDNFVEVDESLGPDNDTTYSSSNVVGAIDLYEVEDSIVNPSAIMAVLIRSTLKKSDAGARDTRLLANTGTIGQGATNTLLTDYSNFNEIFETDPSTDGAPFTLANVNAMQIGVEIIT